MLQKFKGTSIDGWRVNGRLCIDYNKETREARLSLFWLERGLELGNVSLAIYIKDENITEIINQLKVMEPEDIDSVMEMLILEGDSK